MVQESGAPYSRTPLCSIKRFLAHYLKELGYFSPEFSSSSDPFFIWPNAGSYSFWNFVLKALNSSIGLGSNSAAMSLNLVMLDFMVNAPLSDPFYFLIRLIWLVKLLVFAFISARSSSRCFSSSAATSDSNFAASSSVFCFKSAISQDAFIERWPIHLWLHYYRLIRRA